MIFVINIYSTMIHGLSNGLRGIADFSKAKKSCESVFTKNIKGKIEFKNVSFYYPTKPKLKSFK